MGNKVLVVVDMQKDFVDGVLGTPEAVAIVPNVVDKIKNHTGKIYVTLDTHTEDYMNTQEGHKLPVPHCIKGTEGWKLNADVEAVLADKDVTVFEKPTFGSVDLASELLNLYNTRGIEQITFLGLCTGICVISNAMLAKASMPEVPILVDASCSACVTPDSHNTALEAMKLCQIEII